MSASQAWVSEHTVRVLARCVHGIEWVCADEIVAALPDATNLVLSRREVAFSLAAAAITRPDVGRSLLGLRTVDDVFLRLGHVDDVGTGRDAPARLARRVAGLDLDTGLGQLRLVAPRRPIASFDVVASLEGRRAFNRYAVENAVGAALAPVLRADHLARTGAGRAGGEPDLTVRIFVRGSIAVVTLRVGPRPLHRRAYKQDTGPATLHPPLAAAMARLAGASTRGAHPSVILDPFCGDATIAIECALAYPDALILASDIDANRLANARRNACRAGTRPALVRADAAHPPWRVGAIEAVVTNPPWSVGVAATGALAGRVDPLWAQLLALLDQWGRICVISDAAADTPAALHRAGYALSLRTRVRLAGRISHLILAAAAGRLPDLPPSLASWRRRAIADAVVTEAGF